MLVENPFSGRGVPVKGSRLVGREVVLDRLVKRMASESHCSIVGLPRMGKTSLVMEVRRKLVAGNSSINAGYMTLDAIRDPIQAYSRILEEIKPNSLDIDFTTTITDHDEAYAFFLRCLRKYHRSGDTSVIIIDEFDAIIREDFPDAQIFVSRIREIANDRDRYGITFLFVSRRSLDMIQGVVDCSTLAGLCEVIYLQPLNKQGLNHLCLRSPLPVDPFGFEVLWSITGGHPFLAEVVMCEAVENIPHGQEITAQAIEHAQSMQSHEFTNQYQQLAKLLAQDTMFESLCELIVGPHWRPIPLHTSVILKHYGLLRSNDEGAGSIACMSEHFKEYLSLLTRTMPSWVLLGDTERQLRYLIQDRMMQEFGEAWFETLQNSMNSQSITLLLEKRTKEKKQFGDAASDFILDYTYIDDLKIIIFNQWEKYRPIFGGTKADWNKRFEDIVRVRNPMAHHRPIPNDVLQEAERSCKVILSRISSYKC